MKLTCNSSNINPSLLLKQAGYHPIKDIRGAKAGAEDAQIKESWARNLGRGHYPRFHLYVSSKTNQLTLNLHLDQKQSTAKIKGLSRHAGEYDGPVVEEEAARIQRWITYLQSG